MLADGATRASSDIPGDLDPAGLPDTGSVAAPTTRPAKALGKLFRGFLESTR